MEEKADVQASTSRRPAREGEGSRTCKVRVKGASQLLFLIRASKC